MKLLEIKNNLAKIMYNAEEPIALARFIALQDSVRSYVAQIVNLKADVKANYAIAKLIFTVSEDGIIDNYDGTIPSLNSQLSYLNAKDITDLIPLEKPIALGYLAQQDTMLKVDQAVFEKNLVICAEKFDNINVIIRNFTAQLNESEEKIVVIDTDHTFGEFEAVRFKRDFKLPLNAEFIDFILDNELEGVEAASKAVIHDIFAEVKEYINTLPEKFIPFETFYSVVATQYQSTEIPELALLKNKLLKYQSHFAQEKEDIDSLKDAILKNKITYIDIDDDSDELQNELIEYIHNILDKTDKYVYVFVKLSNRNSNKHLLKQILDNNHIFTTIICSHTYKYLAELKQKAENIIFFAPPTVQHDFAAYNSFLNKLNPNEFIIYGSLTQNIPFIVELAELTEQETDYIKETTEAVEEETEEAPTNIEQEAEAEEPVSEQPTEVLNPFTQQQAFTPEAEVAKPEPIIEPESIIESEHIIEPEPETIASEESEIAETQADDDVLDFSENFDTAQEDVNETEALSHDELVEQVAKDVDEVFYNKTEEIPSIDEVTAESSDVLTEGDLDFIDELPQMTTPEIVEDAVEPEQTEVETTEEDLNLEDLVSPEPVFEDIPQEEEIVESPEELPVFPTEDDNTSENIPIFEQGDMVSHPKYGKGVIEKLIKYGNKTLCSISFENVGRRLLDPAMSELEKI